MKKNYFSLIIILFLGLGLIAQPEYYNDFTGASSNTFPLASATNKVQWIYGAGVFNSNGSSGNPAPPGLIDKIYIKLGSAASSATVYSDFTIKLGQNQGTNTSWSSASFTTGLTTCLYQSSYSLSGAATNSWCGIELQTPFFYNPALSLVFELSVSSTSGSNYMAQVSTTGMNQRIWGTYSGGATSFGTGLVNFGIDVSFLPVPNNAGVTGIPSIENGFCADTVPIDVEVTNFGNNIIDSVYVDWEVNGVAQTGTWFVLGLDTMGSGNNDTVVNIGQYYFNNSSTYNVKAWTSMPNNENDTVNNNDTTEVTAGAALAGTYIIGSGSGADYPTFTAAVADLNLRGVCDTVIFNAQSGTYSEQVSINSYVGAAANRPVTFQSLTGNPADVNLTFAGTTTTNEYVVKFNGADYVTFKDMTITNTGTTYSVGFEYTSGSDYNTVDNCDVVVASNVASTYANAVRMYVAMTTGNTFKNSSFNGGYYCMYIYSGSSTSFGYDVTIDNNEITTGYYYAIYNYGYRNSVITRNHISAVSTSPYMYGVYKYYSDGGEISSNYIGSTAGSGAIYALYMAYSYGLSLSNPMKIHNNCIISGYQGATATTSYYGAYMAYSGLVDFYNNTITKYSGTSSYPLVYITSGTLFNLYNNNLSNYVGGQVLYVSSGIGVGNCDYNNYYTSGGSLVYFNGGTYSNLSSYVTATGLDAHSLSEDPDFQVAYECITCNSDLDNSGTALAGVLTDIVGNNRSTSTPDIGAVEYIDAVNFTLGPDTTLCGNTYTIEAGPAQSVSWLINSTSSSGMTATLNNTGSAPMNFNVQVSVVTQYCGNASDVAVIRLVPNASLDSTDHICADGSVTLSPGGGSAATYNWSTGASTSTITVDAPGTYSVTKSEEGCESSASIDISQSVAVQIDDVEVCQADVPVTVDATIPDGLSYAWSGGSSINTAVNTFDQTGTYTVTATDTWGCSSEDALDVVVVDVPVAVITETHLGSVFFFSSASSIYATSSATYFWDFGDGNTSTDANPVHGYAWSGAPQTYSVSLTMTNQCGEDITTTTAAFDLIGIGAVEDQAITLYPNPATESVTVNFNSLVSSTTIELIDITGRVLIKSSVTAVSNSTIDVHDVSAGSYFVKVTSNNGMYILPLVVE